MKKHNFIFLLIVFLSACTQVPEKKVIFQPQKSIDSERNEKIKRDKVEKVSPVGVLQFRGNNYRNFYGAGRISEQEPIEIWSFKTEDNRRGKRLWRGLGWTGQPAIAKDNNVWVVYAAALDGYVYKLDLLTGKMILKSPRNLDIMKSSPAITDKYVVVGSWSNAMHILDRKTLMPIHAHSAIYTPSVSYDFDSSAAIEGDAAYFAGEDGYVRKIQLQPPFKQLWLYPKTTPRSAFKYKNTNKPYVGIESSVAIYEDTVIVGSGRGKVFFIHKQTGELIQQFNTGDDTDATPVIDADDGSVYIGVEKDFSLKTGGLYKLDKQGNVVWFFPIGATGVYATAAVFKDSVIVTGDDAYLYAINKLTGKLKWKQKLHAGSWSSPIVVDNKIIAADYANYLYAFDGLTGKLHWKKRLGGYIVSSPVVWNDTIVVGTRDGYIRALGWPKPVQHLN